MVAAGNDGESIDKSPSYPASFTDSNILAYGDLRYAIRRKVDTPPALDGKVAYDGRLNARKALAAIGALAN